MCSNLYREEHIFILQQTHSFIIEQLLCAWRGARAEAMNGSRQLHGVGGGAADAHPQCSPSTMHSELPADRGGYSGLGDQRSND